MNSATDLSASPADLKRLIWTARLALNRARQDGDEHAARRAERWMNAMLDKFAHMRHDTNRALTAGEPSES